MLRLKWIENRVEDSDGERSTVHYLFDEQSERCYATIYRPRKGNLLYVTDIRVAGVDRSYMSLEAAQSHCEAAAVEDDMKCAEEALKNIRSADAAVLAPVTRLPLFARIRQAVRILR